MRTGNSPARRVARFTITLALVFLALSGIKLYRVRAAEEGSQFQPTAISPVIVPAGTQIQAALRNGIVESAEASDPVTVFVSLPVTVGDRVPIPAGAELKGKLKSLSVFGETGRATVDFKTLTIDHRNYVLHAQPAAIDTPLLSDTAIVGEAFRALFGASLMTGIGAYSRDARVIRGGVVRAAGETVTVQAAIPITVVLIDDLKV